LSQVDETVATRSNGSNKHRKRILVAGIGNVLRGDDGFGPAVIAALEARTDLPAGVQVVEVGIGGISLVHELMAGYEALIIVDAVERDGRPGSLYVLEPAVPQLASLTPMQRRDLAADMHQAVPGRALIIAQAVDALPPVVRIVGCQPAVIDELIFELSPPVQATVATAVNTIISLAQTWTETTANGHG
jgi:hydrogenase maturation protease